MSAPQETVIPFNMYHDVSSPSTLNPRLALLTASPSPDAEQFRNAIGKQSRAMIILQWLIYGDLIRSCASLAKKPYNQEEAIATYKRLIRSLPRANQYLLLYLLDLLSVFARKCDKNLMTPASE